MRSTRSRNAFFAAVMTGAITALFVPVASAATTQEAYVKASNTQATDLFGGAVAISGNTMVVGAIGEDSGSPGVNSTPNEDSSLAGAAYVYVRSGGTWTLQAYLKPSSAAAGDLFGASVAIDGDTIVVGAPNRDAGGTNSGSAWVFTRSGGGWSQQALLDASNSNAGDQFGISVAIDGDTIAVGASGERSNATGVGGDQTDNSFTQAGAAYVFLRTGTTWSQQAYLKASNTDPLDAFGHSVAVSGDTVVVGALLEDGSAAGVNGTDDDNANDAGAAYVYTRSAGVWSFQAYLKASDPGNSDRFGDSVGISGDTIVVGAPERDGAGAAYVFTRSANTWSQQELLTASNPGGQDLFGWSVAISGDTIIAGALTEDSSATTVNGDQTNNDAGDSGAAYTFIRSGTDWTQKAYLKASNAEAGDQFGTSVSVDGDRAVVGAQNEDSNATLVNGGQTDNSALSAGAAYVFSLRSTPTFSTSATDVTLGGAILDTATVSGGDNPTGTVTFNVYGPNDATCANPPVFTSADRPITGGQATSAAFMPASAGTYRWIATYNGDANNVPVSGQCGDANETSTVAQITPALSTSATGTVTLGGSISDTATLTGGSSPSGTVTFNLYGPNDATCSNPPVFTSANRPITGGQATSAAFTPTSTGTYRWIATYNGDANNAIVSGICDEPGETSTVNPAPTQPAQPGAQAPNGEDSKCKRLRKKLRRWQARKLAKANTQKKREYIDANIAKTKAALARLGCV